jgi:hypothetical protein
MCQDAACGVHVGASCLRLLPTACACVAAHVMLGCCLQCGLCIVFALACVLCVCCRAGGIMPVSLALPWLVRFATDAGLGFDLTLFTLALH